MGRRAVIGIDPGATTGLVVRRGEELLDYALMRFTAPVPTSAELRQLGARLDSWVADGVPLLAVESVHAPNPHLGVISVGGILAAAVVLGAVLALAVDPVLVEPARHGQGPLQAYPPALRPTRGRGAGRDQRRHLRSSWDIAGAAVLTVRLGASR